MGKRHSGGKKSGRSARRKVAGMRVSAENNDERLVLRSCGMKGENADAADDLGFNSAASTPLGTPRSLSPLRKSTKDAPPIQSSGTVRKKRSSTWLIVVALLLLLLGGLSQMKGVRRSWKFWNLMFPIVVEYKFTELHAKYWLGIQDEDELTAALLPFHEKTAPKIHRVVLEMGGLIVKSGQIVSTLGTGFVPDPYVSALQPLQDGVTPRSYQEIAAIIEASTTKSMTELFEEFEPTPIGAASIAQAHKAVLKHNHEPVVIKVQYPDVAELFDVDFNNVKAVVRLVDPENMDFVNTMRKTHERELDFTVEADNLREVQSNLQRHNVEPQLVRIPAVKNETGICSKTVLAIEYLPGISMKKAIEDEQHRVALGLGLKNAAELRQTISARMRETHTHTDRNLESRAFSARKARLMQTFGPPVAAVLRVLGGFKEWCSDVLGHRELSLKEKAELRKTRSHVNLGRALKTLVHVHGLQMLKDGVLNMDPHPGNVLILPDGRLGLLDYGMVGRLTDEERRRIAAVVVALAKKDKKEVVRLYREGGYTASWNEGPISDVNILHRFASFHLDTLNLSPVITEDRRSIDILHILHSTVEHAIPQWVEVCRRMGSLMLGAAAQAARPISLSHEWRRIAKQALREFDARERRDQ